MALKKADQKLTQKQAAHSGEADPAAAWLRREGDQAVIHAARGRSSNRKISAKTNKQAIAVLSQPEYAGFGPAGGGVSDGIESAAKRCGAGSAAGLWKPRRRKARRPHRGGRGAVAAASWCWDTSEHAGWRDAATLYRSA